MSSSRFVRILIFSLTLNASSLWAERPNFLLIAWEDVSPRWACYGDELARTPVLDALDAGGIRCDQAFAVASVRAPSRSAISALDAIRKGASE